MTRIKVRVEDGSIPSYARTFVEINGVLCNDLLSFQMKEEVGKPTSVIIEFTNPEIIQNTVRQTWRDHYEA